MKLLKFMPLIVMIFVLTKCNRNGQLNADRNSESISKDTLPFDMHIVDKAPQSGRISMDSTYMLINGTYAFPSHFEKGLPPNSVNYFKSINFPYYLPSSLSINFFCKKLPFTKLEDFYIFNKMNGYTACEYIALIDTLGYSKVIARKCEPMEGWISLFVIDKKYKVISMALLIISGGESPEESISYEGKEISYKDYKDSLNYSKGIYKVTHSAIYQIVDQNGGMTQEIGHQIIKSFIVNPNGEIKSKDSIVINKDYVDLLNNLHSN